MRIKDNYYDYEMIGVEGVVLKRDRGSVLLGFPLDSPFGWYDKDYSTEHLCRWVGEYCLEPITTFTRSKFK